jgi:spore germination cell wall hydrolase CwlJ-like protein
VTVLKILFLEAVEELRKRRGRELACVAMLLGSASCVPLSAATAPEPALESTAPAATPTSAPPPAEVLETKLEAVAPDAAVSINASIPIAALPNPRASSIVFRAAGPIDQMRALQCLAEAVYYEARSESEEGQRAVAQVVLNRVRHPSYPSSVCGVVYQGPMRAGGGCQFTFTCDGSLGRPAAGFDWAQARRIAAEALAGKVYAPVGHATHYHTHQVLPSGPYRRKGRVIGAHNFYRSADRWGTPRLPSRSGYAPGAGPRRGVSAARLPCRLRRCCRRVYTAPPAPPLGILPIRAPAPFADALPGSEAGRGTPSGLDGTRGNFAILGRWIELRSAAAMPATP